MDAIEKEIIHRYEVLGYGQKKAGEPFGVSQYLVKQILQRNNVPIRNFSQAAVCSNKIRAITVNHDFLDIENQEMAYVLGIWASDGTVRKKNNEVKLTLQEEDSELLEAIAKVMGYQGKIRHYKTTKGYANATLAFTSEKLKKKFAEYGITPEKTFSFIFPIHLNKKYWIDFIRGYFDGDGSFSTAGPHAIRSQLCSMVKETLDIILNFLEEQYGIPKVTIYQRADGLWYFQYSTNSTKKLYEALYRNDPSLFLKRKRKKLSTLCE